MEWEAFRKSCNSQGYPSQDIEKFRQAYSIAEKELHGRNRLSGEPFCWHNIRVGSILTENKSSPEVVIAGLLHNLTNKETIKKDFNSEILSLIQGVQDIKQIKSKNSKLEAEALRKIIVTTLKDIRIIVIKLAHKLDNIRDISPLPKEKQQHMAQEVLDIYAPLAFRLGLEKIRVELENSAFKILNPKQYQEIVSFLEETYEKREKQIAHAIHEITKITSGKVPIIKIKGRPKHIYSIYKKMTVRGVSLQEQHDLLGIRIIVPNIKDCYTVLGVLHEHFEPLEGKLKDYIANPKPNVYQSIHTAAKLPTGKIAEIQIRTPEMNELAEEGLAAHWQYKGLKSEEAFEKKVAWLREILKRQKELEGKEFLETAKVDIFGDKIYCYTPKGDTKELPRGATVLDFAYAVHIEVGHRAVAGRVNGKFFPLRHELTKGDVVEILINKQQHPHRDWLKIVKSAGARQKIRKFLKGHEKISALHYRTVKPTIAEDQGVLVEAPEIPTALCLLAQCCTPLPGEPIVGIITKRRVISVHSQECRSAVKEEERWITVSWKTIFNQKIKFFVHAEERSGLLADLLHTIAFAKFEVKDAKAKLIDRDYAECSFAVIPKDLEHLKELVKRVQKVRGVKKMYFE